MIRENKKYLIRMAKLRRVKRNSKDFKSKPSTAPSPSQGPNSEASRPPPPPPPPAVAPTCAANLIERYLSLCSVVLQQPLGPRALLSTQLCLAVSHQMSQDTPSNVVLFTMRPRDPAARRGASLYTFERNAAAGDLITSMKSEYMMKTAYLRSGMWKRAAPTDIWALNTTEARHTSQIYPGPLVFSLFGIVLGFFRRQIPRIGRLPDSAASTIVVLLDILYRHFTYQLHARVETDSIREMSFAYAELGRLLIRMILSIGQLPRLEKPPSPGAGEEDAAPPLVQALYQSAHFLHLLLCVRGQVLAEDTESGAKPQERTPGHQQLAWEIKMRESKNNGPTARLLFELTRNGEELARVRERLSWSPLVQQELAAVAAAAENLEQLFDSRTGTVKPSEALVQNDAKGSRIVVPSPRNWGHGMSPFQVQQLLKGAESELHVSPLVPSRQVRETAVFDERTDQRFLNQVANSIVQDFATLYLCGEENTSALMNEEESHWRIGDEI
eukprot:CAMPEP_0184486554 /NCGR_PEP_ID=MMETSP0113_2-20130426/8037_1 /TAXON_ID=91329 /ORGANISM="Norrisiella sphaerica, Strain BC52" /LENGTH=498 /DNA_ID=CAMNT_0026868481 /DNA_START=66 /DNA_END=1562 /DNA_ORIENTATION=+